MELLEEPLRQRAKGVVVDSDTRRKKQQQLMTKLLERKIRLHAQHLYDQRGQAEGMALQDWVQAGEGGQRGESRFRPLGLLRLIFTS
jgi:polyphosphate kinase